MGQRHQFYVKLPFEVYQEKEVWEQTDEGWKMTGKKHKYMDIVGLHHQWHYGTLPLKSAKRLLDFYYKSINSGYEYSTFKKSYGEASDIEKILSVDFENGEMTNFSLETFDVAENPQIGDNNDGITIIDLSQEKPKIAFMFIDVDNIYKPMTAEQYVRWYYNDVEYARFIADIGWSVERTVKWEEMVVDLINTYDAMNIETLTLEEIKSMFPKMYEVESEENAS